MPIDQAKTLFEYKDTNDFTSFQINFTDLNKVEPVIRNKNWSDEKFKKLENFIITKKKLVQQK
jgi:hypothetical protein